MPITERNYTAGKFLLELDGNPQGFVFDVTGGEPVAPVITELAVGGVVGKHLGPPDFTPIAFSFGPGMDASLYQWIADVLAGHPRKRSGAISMLDYIYGEQLRLSWGDALITRVELPSFDATSQAALLFRVTLQAIGITRAKGSGAIHAGFGSKAPKRWLASNFRLTVDGLDSASSRVNKVEPIVIDQPVAVEQGTLVPGVLGISNLSFTVSNAFADEVYAWLDDFVVEGNNGDDHERKGRLLALDPSLKDELFAIDLVHLGIITARQERVQDEGSLIARLRVELYCEELKFTHDPSVEGVATDGAEPAIGRGRVPVRPVIPTTILRPEITAERLVTRPSAERFLGRAIARPPSGDPEDPARGNGEALGLAWAAGAALLGELAAVAKLDGGQWDAVALESDHSLIAHLRNAGFLPKHEIGPIDLERDEFVEGLVAGASNVYQQVEPFLPRA